MAHVELADGRPGLRPVRRPADHQPAGPTDPLPAVVVKLDRIIALLDQLLVEHVEQFEERHMLVGIRHGIRDEPARRLRPGLPPDF